MVYSVKLNWKEFSVDLPSIEAWAKEQFGSAYKGNSADESLTLWFDRDVEKAPVWSQAGTVTIPAVPAVKAAGYGFGINLIARDAGVLGNVTIQGDGTKTMTQLLSAWNAANPDKRVNGSGSMSTVLDADESITLSGGLDQVDEQVIPHEIFEPTGEPSDADKIRAKWASIQSNSPEALAYAQKAAAKAAKNQVIAINAFTSDLLAQFAAENISMGITQDGKTEDVLDIMLPVMNALQGGAPTVAIKRAKAISPSQYDSKYVTAARLLSYVNKIEAFLGLPQSSSLS